jgi:hypothetical protein
VGVQTQKSTLPEREVVSISHRGAFYVGVERTRNVGNLRDDELPPWFEHDLIPPQPVEDPETFSSPFGWESHCLGFTCGVEVDDNFAFDFRRNYFVIIPYWAVVLATAIPPALILPRKVRGQSRRRRGRCVCCGYNLGATPDRCPECGAIPEGAKGSAA